MSEKVAPVVIDKDGNPKLASQAVQRLAREIVERSGANSVELFNRVVFGEVSFRDQTKEYLRWAGSRDWKRIKDLVSVEGALTCLSSIRRNSAVRRSWPKPSTNLFKKAMAMNRLYIFCLLHPECEFQRRLRSKGEILSTTGVRFRCGSKFTATNPSSSPLKTDAVYRDIELHPEVAEYLRVFICGKDGLLFKTRNGTPHLHNDIEERWLTERLKAMQLDERGMGWHAFRRFRTHGCEGGDARRTSRISGLAISLGPCPSCIRTCSRKRSFDLRKSAQVGVGFDIPAYIAPNCSKGSVRSDVQVSM